MNKILNIHYLRNITPLAQTAKGDWVDLRAGKDVDLKKGDVAIIPLGFAMRLPEGYEALVAPRSSTIKKFGIMVGNSIGIIDESYSGDDDEWGLVAYAIRDTHISMNDRICQFRIIEHQPTLTFHTVNTLGGPSRGGFGSTGHK